jgi:hypothetical protein
MLLRVAARRNDANVKWGRWRCNDDAKATNSVSTTISEHERHLAVLATAKPDAELAELNEQDESILWDEGYYQLAYFKVTKQHTNIPLDYVCEDDDCNIRLG